MKPATIYTATSATTATDRANLYYIASPTARRINHNREARRLEIYGGKKEKLLAIFQY